MLLQAFETLFLMKLAKPCGIAHLISIVGGGATTNYIASVKKLNDENEWRNSL
jgi:hypothetical protein